MVNMVLGLTLTNLYVLVRSRGKEKRIREELSKYRPPCVKIKY